MPTRGLMLPTREIGPRLSDKSKSLADSIACAAACVAGRFRMVVLNGCRHGFCYLHGHCLVGHAMAEIEQSTAGLVAVDAFELEVLLTWARELRLEYEVGS